MEDITKVLQSIAEFQDNCPPIPKNKQGFGYKYAELGTIANIINPILKNVGISYYHNTVFKDVTEHRSITLFGASTTVFHRVSGQSLYSEFSAPITIPKNNKGKDSLTHAQACGVNITYGKRYTLSALLGITTDEDIDGVFKDNDNTGNTNNIIPTNQNTTKQNSFCDGEHTITDAITKFEEKTGKKGVYQVIWTKNNGSLSCFDQRYFSIVDNASRNGELVEIKIKVTNGGKYKNLIGIAFQLKEPTESKAPPPPEPEGLSFGSGNTTFGGYDEDVPF